MPALKIAHVLLIIALTLLPFVVATASQLGDSSSLSSLSLVSKPTSCASHNSPSIRILLLANIIRYGDLSDSLRAASDLRVEPTQASQPSSSSGLDANTPQVDIADADSISVSTPPPTVRPDSMSERNSIGTENDADSQSADAVLYVALGVMSCVFVVAGAVLYKKNKNSPTTPGKDYKSYCPSPFDSVRRASQQQGDDDLHPSSAQSGGEAVAPTTTRFSEEGDELSNSYRTCSRVYSERISSECSSWTMASSRSSSIQSDDDDDAANKKRAASTSVAVSALREHRADRSAMAAFEDSVIESDDEEIDPRGMTESSNASSELFSSFLESEGRSPSAVSWSLGSSWSGSEVSSLDSARATDVTLWSSSSSRSISFRVSDVYSEQELQEEPEQDRTKADETRLPTSAPVAVTTNRCDRILLFKPIKPMRLLNSKRKTPPTAQREIRDAQARQETFVL